jgi:hypothetical protein
MIALTTASGMALHRASVAISARFRDGFSSVHDVGLEFACGRDLVYIDPLANRRGGGHDYGFGPVGRLDISGEQAR